MNLKQFNYQSIRKCIKCIDFNSPLGIKDQIAEYHNWEYMRDILEKGLTLETLFVMKLEEYTKEVICQLNILVRRVKWYIN